MGMQPRLPKWFKVRMPGGPEYLRLRRLLREAELHTVCEEARCPNIGECWEQRAATFMILGGVCTRACRYCAVTSGKPLGLDRHEPERLARTVKRLSLSYCVITSVDRDDLPDGGASVFAECLRLIRDQVPGCGVEVLVSDFQFDWKALAQVMKQRPDVLNHNIETVRRVFSSVRPKGDYDGSLGLLWHAKRFAPEIPTKSGMMVGLGETWPEILETMEDLRDVECDLLTIGQYLRPSPRHVPVERFYTPAEFGQMREEGIKRGFRHVASGPLVRSSYRAEDQAKAAQLAAVTQQ